MSFTIKIPAIITKKTRRSKRSKNKKNRLFWRATLILILILGFSFHWFILKGLPSPKQLTSPNANPVSTKILDRNGKLLYEIYTEKNRTPVSLNQLPDYVKWATIAAEDKDFYKHKGFSLKGIARSVYNIIVHRKLQGGSTITQQLTKNALLSQERTLRRKIKEAVLTYAIELLYTKDQILEMYLNQVPYGGTSYGIGAAAQNYFGKKAPDLTLPEVALLAGLPASPTRYSPFGANPELAKQRQVYVLRMMATDKFISWKDFEKYSQEKLTFREHDRGIKAPHFVMYVKDQLVKKYGESKVEQGGLRVTTTLDLDLQEFAQVTVASEVAKLQKQKVSNGAALVTNPETGEILAMVGSKDYFDKEIGGNFNVTTSLRQPGSSIKPLNYVLGLTKKIITPATLILDIPTCFRALGSRSYCPNNYDNQFHGPTQVRFALGNSFNIPAVKVLALNGLEDFISTASAMGITTFQDPKNYGLSLTLGGGEVKMVDMAVAYGVLANQGVRQNLISILKVEDYTGKILEEAKFKVGPRILPPEPCYLISHILLDNNARTNTFGASSLLKVKNHPEVSVKTGTTNEKRDNWVLGYTPSFLVAAWVGNNNNQSMGRLASGVTGATPIWNKIMSFVLEKQDRQKGKLFQEWLTRPEGVTGASICALSGLAPGDSNCPTRYEYFINGTVPSETESLRRSILINKETGQPVQSGRNYPPEKTEVQERQQVLTDLTGSILCLDCPFPTEPAIFEAQRLKTPF
jgi:penicillin-binding protein 1C